MHSSKSLSFLVHGTYVIALLVATSLQKAHKDSIAAALFLLLVVAVFALGYWRLYRASGIPSGPLQFVTQKTRQSFLRGVQASVALFVVLVFLLITDLGK